MLEHNHITGLTFEDVNPVTEIWQQANDIRDRRWLDFQSIVILNSTSYFFWGRERWGMNFGFVRHTFVTNDRIEHVKINYFILFFNRKRQASVSIHFENWNFITRSIPTEPKLLSLNGKLSVSDNQLFMNWYGKPIRSLLRSESISVLYVTFL